MTVFFHSASRRAAPLRQHGAAALEFTIAAAIVLLLSLLTVEAARWQGTRQLAHLALMEAARAGAAAHADPVRIRAAFLQALLPLHASPQGETDSRRRLAHDMARGAALMGTTPWRIEILRPDAQAFHDYARPGLPDRRGIFRAHTLTLRLTYLYRPLLPPLRTLLMALTQADGSYAAAARARGLAPIRLELDMEMQTRPADWAADKPYPDGMARGACRRLLCP